MPRPCWATAAGGALLRAPRQYQTPAAAAAITTTATPMRSPGNGRPAVNDRVLLRCVSASVSSANRRSAAVWNRFAGCFSRQRPTMRERGSGEGGGGGERRGG